MKINKAGDTFGGLFSSSSEKFADHIPEMKKDIKKQTKTKDTSWMNPQNQRPIKSAQTSQSSSVLSAGRGGEDFSKSGNRFQGFDTNNSIWDSNKLKFTEKSNDEITRDEKLEIERVRKGMKQDRLDQMISDLEKAPIHAKKSVFGESNKDASTVNKYVPKESNSIFDKGNFERVDEKTAGEKLKDIPMKEKDKSWMEPKSSKRDAGTDFFENLMKGKK